MFMWIVLGVMETQTLLRKSNPGSVETDTGAVLSFCFSSQEEHHQRNCLILWFLVPHLRILVVLGAVPCVIGKAVKPGKRLPWSHSWELCLALTEHKVGLDMDSEKPWITLHFSLVSNLEHLTICYICIKIVKAGR